MSMVEARLFRGVVGGLTKVLSCSCSPIGSSSWGSVAAVPDDSYSEPDVSSKDFEDTESGDGSVGEILEC